MPCRVPHTRLPPPAHAPPVLQRHTAVFHPVFSSTNH
jgi:hypothetical protein